MMFLIFLLSICCLMLALQIKDIKKDYIEDMDLLTKEINQIKNQLGGN